MCHMHLPKLTVRWPGSPDRLIIISSGMQKGKLTPYWETICFPLLAHMMMVRNVVRGNVG